MRKILCSTVILLVSIITSFAQTTYYYSKGKKISLTENTQQVVVLAPKNGNTSVQGGQFVKKIADNLSEIAVYKFSSSYEATRAKSLMGSESYANSMQPCYFDENGVELIPNGYIYVKLKSSSDAAKLQGVASKYNLEIVGQNSHMNLWYTMRQKTNSHGKAVDVANAIYETGDFTAAVPSFTFDGLEISYDTDVMKQWGLYNAEYSKLDMSIGDAWNIATGRGVTIAIVDQGIDLMHQDLAKNIYYMSYDTETGTSPSRVYGDHGTHCAGIAAAVRNNGLQVAGVAPDAKLMSVSNSLSGNSRIEEKLADGINWAWKNGADIISCSWYCSRNDMLEDAIDNAIFIGRKGKGCVFIKSAGNTGAAISYPGDYRKEVIAVANMQKDGSLRRSSARGQNMFVTAPGTDILSTIPHNETSYKTGTSMAAPHVAGLAALILERNWNLSAAKVREIIAKSAKKVGNVPYNTTKEFGTWNERYGYGLVDAYQALLNTPYNF